MINRKSARPVEMEFHVSRKARDRYQFDETLFAISGNVLFANFHAARTFAKRMNDRRDLVNFPERAVRAAQINAMGLIDEILHFVVGKYRQERNPLAIEQALDYVEKQVGKDEVEETLRQFANEFPPLAVYNRQLDLDEYIEGESRREDGRVVSNRQIIFEEMLVLWIANVNPAFSPFLELFNDENLKKKTAYPEIITHLHDFFETQPPFGPDNQNLVDMMRSPAIAVPHSLPGQLEYIRTRWGMMLGKYLYRLLSSLDFIKEEEKAIFMGAGPARVYEFAGLELEPERFSPDKDWMPTVVLLAKNSYVWLDQLSKKYKRPINHLNDIPDEELDTMARWGLTGLWLIGLWERSPASKRIKQLRGNPEAEASAYSLLDYQIAADLGGDEAYRDLRDRAWQRGIRLSSDMVPNHMGIDSNWVMEHPDWFISLDYSPFPSYTFNGPNLSWNERVGIYLEDHYYDSTDAAVVFKRVDFWSGQEKYIYHGNDGTSMPWNDTAQLNYLIPEVREAVIQTILHVARKFPIIRFDAAMTLAKKHYQRLWFPSPGSGGDIPSRAEYGMTKEQFDQVFPKEFWREVVDRVAEEVPDTLLLAEAFWLMEGYFVRTLGMHRVYNSAFMNMMRDEKNQEYRLVIKNTIEFEPEILKRYVNFMNNPDERTAVDQFGKGDKYFGICTVMATMPGLPMLGHGQIQGFAEKYGMEFRRAYWDEKPDPYLIERHEREIFPLLRKRYLFANVENFLLYDFFTPEGNVNEDVFAFSNRSGDERSLVLYHNRFSDTSGWVRMSTAHLVKTEGSDERVLVQKTLGKGLALRNDPEYFAIFRDQISGLEYIRNCQELHEQGLFAELGAYQYNVFLNFREIKDNEWRQYAQLADYLAGRGVPNIEEAMREIFLQPIHRPFRELVNAGFLRWLIDNRLSPETMETAGEKTSPYQKALDEAEQKMTVLLREIKEISGGSLDALEVAKDVRRDLAAALALPVFDKLLPKEKKIRKGLKYLQAGPNGKWAITSDEPAMWGVLLCWLLVAKLGKIQTAGGYSEQSRTWIDEFLLGKMIASALQDLGMDENEAWRSVTIIKLLTSHQHWCDLEESDRAVANRTLQSWLQDTDVQSFIGVNRYQSVLWFNKEAFDEMVWWLFATSVIDHTGELDLATEEEAIEEQSVKEIGNCYAIVQTLLEAEEESDYQVEKLLEAVKV